MASRTANWTISASDAAMNLENFGSGELQPEKCFPVKAAGFQGEALEE